MPYWVNYMLAGVWAGVLLAVASGQYVPDKTNQIIWLIYIMVSVLLDGMIAQKKQQLGV